MLEYKPGDAAMLVDKPEVTDMRECKPEDRAVKEAKDLNKPQLRHRPFSPAMSLHVGGGGRVDVAVCSMLHFASATRDAAMLKGKLDMHEKNDQPVKSYSEKEEEYTSFVFKYIVKDKPPDREFFEAESWERSFIKSEPSGVGNIVEAEPSAEPPDLSL